MFIGRPILVTGAHRSGTTWVGRMLSSAPSVRYVDEPFRTGLQGCACGVRFDYWFQYVTDGNADCFESHIRHAIGLAFNARQVLASIRRLWGIYWVPRMYIRFLRARFTRRPLVKDPIAFFSAEWLARTFDMQVVVLIRHPAAFASSIKQLDWSHPFSHFRDQSLLMQDYLYPFETEIEAYAAQEQGVLDQAALLWRLIYHVASKYQKRHPDWIFIRHEDLSRNPLQGFEVLFNKLGLRFSKHAKSAISEHSLVANPSEPDDPYSIKRNSTANIWNWKDRLTASEIQRVRSLVSDVSSLFYSDDDW